MIATVVNSAAIIIGGLIGSLFGGRIGERYTKPLLTAMAFVVGIIGIQGAIATSNILIVVICIVIGLVIGIALRLDDRINGLGGRIKDRLSGTKLCQGRFSDAIVTSSLLFCVGSMAILGSIQAGLNRDYSTLFTKAVIDGVSAIAFSAALGPGGHPLGDTRVYHSGGDHSPRGRGGAVSHERDNNRNVRRRRTYLPRHVCKYAGASAGADKDRRYDPRDPHADSLFSRCKPAGEAVLMQSNE